MNEDRIAIFINSVDIIKMEAFANFSKISDYIWKTPQFVNKQEKIEMEKLDSYFPLSSGNSTTKRLRYNRYIDEYIK
jgi:hypothetical protein